MSKRVCHKHTLSCIIIIYYGFFLFMTVGRIIAAASFEDNFKSIFAIIPLFLFVDLCPITFHMIFYTTISCDNTNV